MHGHVHILDLGQRRFDPGTVAAIRYDGLAAGERRSKARPNPRCVRVLNIGVEDIKGTEAVKKGAAGLFRASVISITAVLSRAMKSLPATPM